MIKTVESVVSSPANFDVAELELAYTEDTWLDLQGVAQAAFGIEMSRHTLVAVVARAPWQALVAPMQYGYGNSTAETLRRAVAQLANASAKETTTPRA